MGLLSIVDDIIGTDLSGRGAAKAAGQAAEIQAQAGQEALGVIREDLAPFTGVGTEAANLLLQSVLQPDGVQTTAQDVLSDPFFSALAQEQERGTLAERAALGLAGSGGTRDILQRNLLQLGEGFRQQRQNEALQRQQARFNQLFGITQLGQASAAQQGLTGADILTGIGAARSAAPLAQAQAQGQLTSGLFQLGGAALGGFMASPSAPQTASPAIGAGGTVSTLPGGMASFSDSRLKSNIIKIDSDEFGNIYEFSYNGVSGRYRGRIAQELQQVKPDAVSMHESGYLQVSHEFRSELI